MKEPLKEIRRALLEADVALPVVKALVDDVEKKARGVEARAACAAGGPGGFSSSVPAGFSLRQRRTAALPSCTHRLTPAPHPQVVPGVTPAQQLAKVVQDALTEVRGHFPSSLRHPARADASPHAPRPTSVPTAGPRRGAVPPGPGAGHPFPSRGDPHGGPPGRRQDHDGGQAGAAAEQQGGRRPRGAAGQRGHVPPGRRGAAGAFVTAPSPPQRRAP